LVWEKKRGRKGLEGGGRLLGEDHACCLEKQGVTPIDFCECRKEKTGKGRKILKAKKQGKGFGGCGK